MKNLSIQLSTLVCMMVLSVSCGNKSNKSSSNPAGNMGGEISLTDNSTPVAQSGLVTVITKNIEDAVVSTDTVTEEPVTELVTETVADPTEVVSAVEADSPISSPVTSETTETVVLYDNVEVVFDEGNIETVETVVDYLESNPDEVVEAVVNEKILEMKSKLNHKLTILEKRLDVFVNSKSQVDHSKQITKIEEEISKLKTALESLN